MRWLVVAVLLSLLAVVPPPVPAPEAPTPVQGLSNVVRFEPNLGQANPEALFVARGADALVAFGPSWVSYALRDTEAVRVVRLTFEGAPVAPVPEEPLAARGNYLSGDTSLLDVPSFGRLWYRGLAPGIDVVFYGAGRSLEYDVVAAAGTNPEGLRVLVDGADALEHDSGAVLLRVGSLTLRQGAPIAWQVAPDGRLPIEAWYELHGNSALTLHVSALDPRFPTVVDPTIVYASYIGTGGNEHAMDVAAHEKGHSFVVGSTDSTTFPVTPGAFDTTAVSEEAFIMKIRVDGVLAWSTLLGGTFHDQANAVAWDGGESIVAVGVTNSKDFPTRQSGTIYSGDNDAWVARISESNGAPWYVRYLGGPFDDSALGVAATATRAWVVGFTIGSFPVTTGYSPPFGGVRDGFATLLDPWGTIVRSRYLGGSNSDAARDVAIDPQNFAYIVGDTDSTNYPVTPGVVQPFLKGGNDAFVTRLSPTSTSSVPVWSTYVGGLGDEYGMGIAIDVAKQPYIAGSTTSLDYPVRLPTQALHAGGGWDAFATRLDATASSIVVSTYLGGSDVDFGRDVALSVGGETIVVGETKSNDFPIHLPVQATNAGGGADAFLTTYRTTGIGFVHSTYYGGITPDVGLGVSADGVRTAHFVGATYSPVMPSGILTTWPTYAGAHDGYLVRIAPGNTCFPIVGC